MKDGTFALAALLFVIVVAAALLLANFGQQEAGRTLLYANALLGGVLALDSFLWKRKHRIF